MIDEKQLTRGQKRARLHARRGKNLFITGVGGTGKSVIVELIIQDFSEAGKSVVVCAPTGIAALNVRGTTIHAAFGFEGECAINTGGRSGRLSLKTRTPQTIKYADVLIIDEISMVRSELFDAVCASIEKTEKQSGRHIQLIVVGDFYQLPPVIRKKDMEGHTMPDVSLIQDFYHRKIGSEYAFQGIYWDKCKFYPIILTEVVRQQDSEFISNLNKARCGDTSCIDYFNSHCRGELYKDAANLYAYKYAVKNENRRFLSAFSGTEYVYKTKIVYEEGYDENSVPKSIMDDIPKDLHLKTGVHVIFTTNDHYGNGSDDISALEGKSKIRDRNTPAYVNGTGGVVNTIGSVIEGETRDVFVKTDNGVRLLVHPIGIPVFSYRVNKTTHRTERILVATAYQLPLKLAHAITIHSAQGQTYDKVNITPHSFSPGQLYVSLSRARTVDGIRLKEPIKATDLIVDPEVAEFYERIESGEHRQGRPAKNQDGSTRDKLMWIPHPLEKHIRKEIERGYPLKMSGCPAYTYSRDRIHMRVPDFLQEHIKEEIADWLNISKEKAKQKRDRNRR